MQHVMSGQSTADRIAQAEQAAADPKKPKKKKTPTPSGVSTSPTIESARERGARERQEAIDRDTAATLAGIAARQGLRRQ